jgi:hypothetical protein
MTCRISLPAIMQATGTSEKKLFMQRIFLKEDGGSLVTKRSLLVIKRP